SGSVSILDQVQGLLTTGGQTQVQLGSYFKANLMASVDSTSGATTLGFSNAQLKVGDFLSNIITRLQSFTEPFQEVADRLTTRLIDQSWASSLTPIKLLSMVYPDQA